MLTRFLISLVRFYQKGISPWTLPSCRFIPSCSSYAVEALEVHGAVRGSWLATQRICRCHPWGGHGYDPVPPPPVRETTAGGSASRLTSERS